MTKREYILARLQLEREQRMSGWGVGGPMRDRVLPQEPQRVVRAVQVEQERRMVWKGQAA